MDFGGLRFLISLSLFIAIYFGMNHFIFYRLSTGLFPDGRWVLPLRILLFCGAMTFFLGMFYRVWPPLFNLLRFGNYWFGFCDLAITVLLLKYPFDWMFPGLLREVTLVALGVILALTAYSIYNVSRPLRVTNINLRSDKFPASAPAFRLAHISDLHLSRLKSAEWVESVVASVNALSPDAIVITGDMIDDKMPELGMFIPAMKKLSAKYGVFAVPGNHDYYSGLDNMSEFERAAGVRILQNEKTEVGGVLEIFGVDNEILSPARYEAVLERGTKGGRLPIVMLKHKPTGFGPASEKGVFLQLSGHTHAGQIPPLDLIVRLVYEFPFGLYQRGGSYIYTTCGSGTWGPPMRLFSHSEVVLITISR